MSDTPSQNLTTSAQRLVQAAQQKKEELKHLELSVNHWLVVLLERHGAMAESLISGFSAEDIRKKISDELINNQNGLALSEIVVVARAFELAQQRGKLQATERDLAAVILIASGYSISATPGSKPQSPETPQNTAPAESVAEKPKSETPFLTQFGRNLTAAAREGKLSQVLGRDSEMDLMIETLCRRTKRNPVLIGPAGVGKTAVVEGLANRIISGAVPLILQGMDIIALQPSTLIAGASTFGELEKRIQGVLKEASLNKILLFIDEIHTIMGSGGTTGTTDMGAQLKPVLARGEIAVIAATTDDEYRKFIEADTALERRFQPIRINELSAEETYKILVSLSSELGKRYQVKIEDNVLSWLIDFGKQYMRNRHFPDKAVDLLEQSIAHTVAQNRSHCSLTEAKAVAQRMIGMPISLENRFVNLQSAIKNQGGLNPDELQILLNRLQVTMRGLDIRSARPNAILLLSNKAAESSETIASTLAGALFGDSKRVIFIDLSRITQPEDVTMLVGSPPMYVGYGDRVPLHTLLQTPWCVVRFENIDKCHPQIRALIAQSLREGKIMDGRGRPIYFSDAIIIFTASIKLASHRTLGFLAKDTSAETDEVFQVISDSIGADLAEQVDLFMPGVRVPEISKQWLQDSLLAEVGVRFLRQSVRLAWDPSLVEFLYDQRTHYLGESEWERWIDDTLSPLILPYLPSGTDENTVDVSVKIEDNKLAVNPIKKEI